MELSGGYLIKDESIIGCGPLMIHKLSSSNGQASSWGYYYFDIYTVSNTINIRTDNMLYDAVSDEKTKEFLLFKSFSQQYNITREKIRDLIEPIPRLKTIKKLKAAPQKSSS